MTTTNSDLNPKRRWFDFRRGTMFGLAAIAAAVAIAWGTVLVFPDVVMFRPSIRPHLHSAWNWVAMQFFHLVHAIGACAVLTWPFGGPITAGLLAFKIDRRWHAVVGGALAGLILQSIIAVVFILWGVGQIRG